MRKCKRTISQREQGGSRRGIGALDLVDFSLVPDEDKGRHGRDAVRARDVLRLVDCRVGDTIGQLGSRAGARGGDDLPSTLRKVADGYCPASFSYTGAIACCFQSLTCELEITAGLYGLHRAGETYARSTPCLSVGTTASQSTRVARRQLGLYSHVAWKSI